MKAFPAAVVFDMDGLLFDSEALYRDAFIATAADGGHALKIDHFIQLVGRPWSANRLTLQDYLGPRHDPDAFQAEWMCRYGQIRHSIELKPGVLELLAWLDRAGIPRAICTSSGHDDVQHNLLAHGLSSRFNTIVASGDYSRGKPFPDPYLRAAEALGVTPSNCLALEDSYNGVRSAAAAGMQTVMVPDLLPANEEMRSHCQFVARDLHEVRAHLDRIGTGR
jgi:HAD superfamily hydrolase (TIGR01509 family)